LPLSLHHDMTPSNFKMDRDGKLIELDFSRDVFFFASVFPGLLDGEADKRVRLECGPVCEFSASLTSFILPRLTLRLDRIPGECPLTLQH
jgi:hypothetical protein